MFSVTIPDILGCRERDRPADPPFDHNTGKGHVAFHKGDYYDAIYNKNNHVVPLIVEVFGGIASRGARYLRFLARRASDRKRGRDGTAYSDYHASGGFLSHHLARISTAAASTGTRSTSTRASASSSSTRAHVCKRAAATTRSPDRPPPAVARAPDLRPLAVFHP